MCSAPTRPRRYRTPKRGRSSAVAGGQKTPSDEQDAILQNSRAARVRLVAAAPGSGKTWLVGELVRRELECWSGPGGVAALSFTRVARDAIAEALGGTLPAHPHFVGTLDSFVYRYIFKPFGPAINHWLGSVSLLPAAVADHLGNWGRKSLSVEVGKSRVRLFDIHLRRPENGEAQLFYKTPKMGAAARVPDSDREAVRSGKRWLWKTARVASHSDIAYLSWVIATHPKHGKTVQVLLADRFPLIVLDEVQDTSWFLAETVRTLLAEPATRGVIVGDRDQAIYEFGGAHPRDLDTFQELEGAATFPMRASFRCPARVCRVATALSWQNSIVTPAAQGEGHAVLYVYENVPDVEELCGTVEEELRAGPTTVLVRGRPAMANLVDVTASVPKFGSPPIRHLWLGCDHYRAGQTAKALGATQAALARLLFTREAARASDLEVVGLDEDAWRALAVSTLCAAVSLPLQGSLYDWGALALDILKEHLSHVSVPSGQPRRLRNPFKELKKNPASDYLPAAGGGLSRRCTTVHSAKGETHQVTMLFVPKTRSDRCPGTTWFSGATEHGEERRIAFVAASRPRDAFVLCVHKSTFGRFEASAPSFVAEFEVRHLD